MSTETRERILEEGARLVREHGFAATGLDAILKASKVPKGSFYYYFKSKEAFGLELVTMRGEQIANAFQSFLCCEYEEKSTTRLRMFFDYFKDEFTSEDLPLGCPIGNLAQELAAVNGEFRKRLKPVFSVMYDSVACCLSRARDNGETELNSSPEETATFIVNSWQGALIALKVTNSSEPLMLFEKLVFEELLQSKEKL